jgi:hypothetical protein
MKFKKETKLNVIFQLKCKIQMNKIKNKIKNILISKIH